MEIPDFAGCYMSVIVERLDLYILENHLLQWNKWIVDFVIIVCFYKFLQAYI